MSQAYSDPRRASDPHALPDVEVFEGYLIGCDFCDCVWPTEDLYASDGIGSPCPCSTCKNEPEAILTECDPTRRGWFWQACFPGCLPDGDPVGPFDTEAEALVNCRESSGLCEHGTPEDEPCEECPAPELWVIATGDGRYLHFSLGSLNGGACAAWSNMGAATKQAEALTTAGLLIGGCKVIRLPDAEARAWGHAEALADAQRENE